MSLCFQSFNYLPSSINCCLSKDTSQSSKVKKSHAMVKVPASIIPQAEESNSSADSNTTCFTNKPLTDRNFSCLDQANSVGIIGGLSVDSSLNFAKKLGMEEQETGLPFILCSDPTLNKELSSLESGYFPLLSGRTERVHINQSSVVEKLRYKRVFLEKSGVCCVVMPCQILHSWHNEVEDGCSVPLLHMGECVAKELKEEKFRPIEAGSPIRIGVLATNATLAASVYQDKLEHEYFVRSPLFMFLSCASENKRELSDMQGFEVVLPDKATMEHTVIPALDALSRKDFEGAQNLFRIALQVLLVRAVNRIILASDELRQLLPLDDPLWMKCIDPMDALTRSAVKHAQAAGRSK
ncbi:hypothetical protein Sango_0132700 [Sesamum angolense]|uniref:Aspartate racemase n=1 Tax=Sesamum angolense TaxID=2727404 RepID=A0AAE2C673_9LAMI|nr:hypothetical protein Sango_0132700 [Sesamum angolense]